MNNLDNIKKFDEENFMTDRNQGVKYNWHQWAMYDYQQCQNKRQGY